jgi:hypothetical protein
MACLIDMQYIKKEYIYRQPEYNYIEYCVPDKFAQCFQNLCYKPFIMTISETIKYNALKYFGIKLCDSTSYRSLTLPFDENIFGIDKTITNNNNICFLGLDIILRDFEDNICVYNLKEQFDNTITTTATNIIMHHFEKYIVVIIGNITIIKHVDKPLFIAQYKNSTFYFSSNILITHDNALCYVKIKKVNDDGKILFSTNMNSPKFIQNTEYEISHKKIIKKYVYKSLKTHKNISCVTIYTCQKMLSISVTNNNIRMRHFINKKDGTEKLISQCMFSSSETGLRHRGKYKQISSKNNTEKELSVDNATVYKKENNKVVLDLLTAKHDTVHEYIIGWKVAKNDKDEYRIVKLGIPNDSKVVMPVSSDYFALHRKERCDKAIVLDIQEPLLDEIKSVVPHERIAYSCISDKLSIYSIGSVVVPDGFDDNTDISCTNGIHFHRNRRAVFKLWIPEFSDIDCND